MECRNQKAHEISLQRIKGNCLSSFEVERICKIFRLLSDGNRFKIVQALLQGELCVHHLTEVCDSSASGVSHQLRILRDNGIVKGKRFGKHVEYSISDEHIRKIVEMGIEHLKCALED